MEESLTQDQDLLVLKPSEGFIYLEAENLKNFPDVCVECESCMDLVGRWLTQRANRQIKDRELAEVYIRGAMKELKGFLL